MRYIQNLFIFNTYFVNTLPFCVLNNSGEVQRKMEKNEGKNCRILLLLKSPAINMLVVVKLLTPLI